jgi:hypothetical protein
VYVKINSIFKRASPFISDCTFRARMELESIPLYLAKNHLGAVAILAQINEVLEDDTAILDHNSPLTTAKFSRFVGSGGRGDRNRES